MKAIRFMDPGVIEYSEIPQPEIRDDEVLAQIAYAGFCATDIELLTGEMIHIKTATPSTPSFPAMSGAARWWLWARMSGILKRETRSPPM